MTDWIVQTLVATTLLVLLVLALRRPVASAFGPRVAYWLWALPALRFLMPSLPGWRTLYVPVLHIGHRYKVVGLVDHASAARLVQEPTLQLTSLAPMAPLPPLPPVITPTHFPFAGVLLTLWLGGAALWFGWQMLRYLGFLRHAMRSAVRLTRECGVEILITERVDGPVAAGVFKRRIFLPADFMQRYGPAERRLALLHEGAHHDRHDILANLVALAVLALHWWNPLAHRAYRAFRADQELACDATVLAGVSATERHAYGSAVLKSVSARMPGVACALSHKAELKRRLKTMARRPVGSTRLWLGGLLAVSAIGGGLLATASGEANVPDSPAILSPADIADIHAAAEEARRAGEKARIEGMRAAAEARREAGLSREPAHAIAARARAEGMRAAREAQLAARASAPTGQSEIDATKRSMAASCAAQGHPVAMTADWRTLALCGQDMGRIMAQASAAREQALASAAMERRQAFDEARAEREEALAEARAARAQAQAERDAAHAAARAMPTPSSDN